MCIALINELPKIFGDLRIRLPDPICLSDGMYDRLWRDMLLQMNGWTVPRADVQGAVAESYNASLLIDSVATSKKVLITFVEIAGELCYDTKRQAINGDAFRKFPMITSCHLYMLCTCVSQKRYGNANQESANISNDVLLKIVDAIYDNLKDPVNIPPMCLVVTKVDLAHISGVINSRGQNPFEAMGMPRIPSDLSGRIGDSVFSSLEQMNILKNLFDNTDNLDVMESLEWCCGIYRHIFDKTYFTMISCSTLRKQERKNDEDYHDLEIIQSVRLDKVWKWILINLGLMPIGRRGYVFESVPSYGEAYYSPAINLASFSKIRCSCPLSDEKKRIDAISELFLNRSLLDTELHRYDEKVGLGPGEGSVFQRLGESIRMRKREIIVSEYLLQVRR